MGTRKPDALRGLIVPSDRISTDYLTPIDGSFAGSIYTEAEPRPGGSVATTAGTMIRPEVSGDQLVNAELMLSGGGDPTVDEGDGAAAIVRPLPTLSADPDLDWLGWNPPNWLETYKPISFSVSTLNIVGEHGFDVVTRELSQEVIARTSFGCWRLSPGGVGWELIEGAALGNSPTAIALLELPSGRLLELTTAALVSGPTRFSDDGGVTWSAYAPTGGPGVAGGRLSVTPSPSGDLMWFLGDGADRITQGISTDLGSHWDEVEVLLSFGNLPEVKALPTGGFLVAYEEIQPGSAPGDYRIAGLDSATQKLSEATFDVAVDAGVLVDQLGLHIDPDGICYAIGQTDDDEYACYVSRNHGQSWSPYSGGLLRVGDGATEIPSGRLAAMNGGAVWACIAEPTGSGLPAPLGSTEGSLHSFLVGGWSSAESTGLAGAVGTEDREGWGAPDGVVWWPLAEPDHTGWNHAGTLSTGAIVSPGALEINTTAGGPVQTDWYQTLLGAGSVSARVDVEVLTHDGSTTTTQAGVRLRAANGSSEYQLWINVDLTGLAVYDGISGGLLASVTGLSALNVQLLVLMHAARCWVAWRPALAGDSTSDRYSNPWRQIVIDEPLTNFGAGAAQAQIQIGHILGTPALVTRWTYAAATIGTSAYLADHGSGGPGTPPTTFRGKALGATLGYPIPGLGSSSRAARLVLRGGPGPRGELYQLQTAHDHSLANIFPQVSPSPAETWRSTDASVEQILTFDIDEFSRLGHSWSLGLTLLRQNFRTAILEVDDTGVWVALGTWDGAAGLSGLSYVRQGDSLYPDPSAGATAGRYLQRGELRHGIAITGTGPTETARRITYNSAGRWGPSTSTAVPVVQVEDPFGLSGSGSDLRLVCPRGVLFAHLADASADWYRRWRIRIPAQTVPDGEVGHELGILSLGALAVFGQQYSRGWSQTMRPNVEERVSPAGVIRKTQKGEPAIRWSMAWPDGVKLDQLRQLDSPDYLGPSAGLPLVAEQDVWTQLYGLLEEIRGGEIPVVAVAEAPDAGGMVTDRTLFLFGSWSGAPSFGHVLGSEGVDEFGRIEGITVDGIEG